MSREKAHRVKIGFGRRADVLVDRRGRRGQLLSVRLVVYEEGGAREVLLSGAGWRRVQEVVGAGHEEGR